jgi:hypothetical protein
VEAVDTTTTRHQHRTASCCKPPTSGAAFVSSPGSTRFCRQRTQLHQLPAVAGANDGQSSADAACVSSCPRWRRVGASRSPRRGRGVARRAVEAFRAAVTRHRSEAGCFASANRRQSCGRRTPSRISTASSVSSSATSDDGATVGCSCAGSRPHSRMRSVASDVSVAAMKCPRSSVRSIATR